MIDIHCHILPGVDDGSENDQMSLAMAKQAIAEGITQIVATPHHRNRTWDNPKFSIERKVARLNALFSENHVPLDVLPGQEPRIFGEMAEGKILHEELMSVNNTLRYMLVEFPTHHLPHYAQQLFYELQVKGVTPIIVHPERNEPIIAHPEFLYEFIVNGALSQITAASLIGKNGKKIQKLSMQFLENNLTHFIASDAHNLTARPFYMKEAFRLVKKSFGYQFENQLIENADQIIRGERIDCEPPAPIREKKFLGLF